ncbi:MAG TPA: hypothetical protein VNN07_02090 [Candidatus Tectomicrobia bacterium]|nr:hypothetical protein [Candidatus Tectomicrobia bacterium]
MTPVDPQIADPDLDERPRPVARRPKLFIVARGRTTEYMSLKNSLESDEGIEVVYDRRSGRGSSPAAERRQPRSEIDDQLKSRGWAVVPRTL